jgi:hypothetical protein
LNRCRRGSGGKGAPNVEGCDPYCFSAQIDELIFDLHAPMLVKRFHQRAQGCGLLFAVGAKLILVQPPVEVVTQVSEVIDNLLVGGFFDRQLRYRVTKRRISS